MQSDKEILNNSSDVTCLHYSMTNTMSNPQQQFSVASASHNQDNISNKESHKSCSSTSHKSLTTPQTLSNDVEPLLKVELFLAII